MPRSLKSRRFSPDPYPHPATDNQADANSHGAPVPLPHGIGDTVLAILAQAQPGFQFPPRRSLPDRAPLSERGQQLPLQRVTGVQHVEEAAARSGQAPRIGAQQAENRSVVRRATPSQVQPAKQPLAQERHLCAGMDQRQGGGSCDCGRILPAPPAEQPAGAIPTFQPFEQQRALQTEAGMVIRTGGRAKQRSHRRVGIWHFWVGYHKAESGDTARLAIRSSPISRRRLDEQQYRWLALSGAATACS